MPDLWTHPNSESLVREFPGPFVKTRDGTIVTLHNARVWRSADGGVTWKSKRVRAEDLGADLTSWPVLLCTRKDTLIAAFLNTDDDRAWGWDEEKNQPIDGVRLTVWTARSIDGGETWTDAQRVQDDYCGAVRDMIELHDGAIVFTAQHMASPQPYHTTVTYRSDDDGVTWTRGSTLDLGGRGHHDGAFESTIIQLRDRRLWMLLRTNHDRFWQAFSRDGLTWTDLGPSAIEASSSPGMLTRLASGRIILAWNRLHPEGQGTYERRGVPYSDPPGSWHRDELSIAFSDDDGATWSSPTVIARQPKAWLSYPTIFEPSPGEVWITTMQGNVRVKLREADFVS